MKLCLLARKRGFQCLHRYAVEDWSAERNHQEFGACFSPHGHGHNYELEVYLQGPIDPMTGMIVNLSDVDQWMEKTLAPFDGKHLNFEVPEFKTVIPTTENLAELICTRLIASLNFKNITLRKMRLYEYADLWVDVWPS